MLELNFQIKKKSDRNKKREIAKEVFGKNKYKPDLNVVVEDEEERYDDDGKPFSPTEFERIEMEREKIRREEAELKREEERK